MKTLIMLCCAVIALLQPLQARNYYLSSSSGSDANAGTSSNAPWQTLTKLATQTQAVRFYKYVSAWDDRF